MKAIHWQVLLVMVVFTITTATAIMWAKLVNEGAETALHFYSSCMPTENEVTIVQWNAGNWSCIKEPKVAYGMSRKYKKTEVRRENRTIQRGV